ncbi:SBBP repeat-containing protein [Paraflavisolibacter sp. H34]|uniref:SBBP repeat-containing protein n=1 Tax=Huijunlia imazamoxiresistens TaxID=3127457 RepID=UPI0030197A65
MTHAPLCRIAVLLAALLLLPPLCFSQVSREWVKRYKPTGGFSADVASALAVDGSGNVLVTGWQEASEKGLDFTTVKYDKDGSQKWLKQYNGPGNGDDKAMAVVLDGSGNVYVTGSSPGSGTGADFATLKYGSDGSLKWTKRYDGPLHGDDAPVAVAVDGSGNVYVSGISPGTASGEDYTTLKYDAAGNLLWTARYDGPGNADDQPTALAVDASGNVYVTGRSKGPVSDDRDDFDYATVKYNAAGAEQWVRRHDAFSGPYFYSDHHKDEANALCLDASGNVYVTGRVTTTIDEDDGAHYDNVTIKYNAAGTVQWLATFGGGSHTNAFAIAADPSNNVYITGYSGHDEDVNIATIKYNATGVQQWAASYSASEFDQGRDIAIDAGGNVLVTGQSFGGFLFSLLDYVTLKYTSAGVQTWVKQYNGPANERDQANAIGLDASGNVYITGFSPGSGTSTDFATLKYSSSGSQQWVKRLNGLANGNDQAAALAVNGSGKVYVTGQGAGSSSPLDYHTIKLNEDGSRSWEKTYNGPNNHLDAASALAVDGSGNIYVTGYSHVNVNDVDFATIKYGSDGSQKWAKRYNGPGTYTDKATALAVDASGNAYVTGDSYGANGNLDYAILKYNSSGTQQWLQRYDGDGHSNDHATAIAMDANHVYVTGWGEAFGTTAGDIATLKFDKNGSMVWARRYNGTENGHDIASAVAVDASGNVYVTGRSPGTGSIEDYLTIKYNAAGIEQWVARYNGDGNGFDEATDVAVDGSGNVYVTGVSVGSGDSDEEEDVTTVKYNAAGVQQWAVRYDHGFYDKGNALVLDGAGNIYVTGQSDNVIFENSDYVTVKYNAAGVQQWADRFNGTGDADDAATSIAVDQQGKVYVTGVSAGLGTGNDYLTIKYSQATAAITRETPGLPESMYAAPARLLLGHFPNPVAATARIRYQLPIDGQVSLQLYDELGRLVFTLVEAPAKKGAYTQDLEASQLSRGVYYYRLRLKSGKELWEQTNKMIVER